MIKEKINEVQNKIQKILLDFQKETGVTITKMEIEALFELTSNALIYQFKKEIEIKNERRNGK